MYGNMFMQPSYQQPVNGLIKVSGRDGANAYYLPPNSAAALFHESENIMYVKTTDGAGFPTVREFDFSERNVEQEIRDRYVSREEFEKLKEMVENGKQPVSTEPRQQHIRRNQQRTFDDWREPASGFQRDDAYQPAVRAVRADEQWQDA